MIRRLLALALALAGLVVGGIAVGDIAFGASARSTPASTEEPAGATVFVGTGGITWTDVSEEATPNLWTLLRDGSSAAMSIRSVNRNTCPVDGWLGLSAGGRAAAPGPVGDGWPGRAPGAPCPAVPTPALREEGVAVPGWDAYEWAADAKRFGTELGTLGRTAQEGGVCLQAVGRGAALAAALPDGTVERYRPWDPDSLVADLNTCPLTVVDVGSLRAPGDVSAREQTPGPRAEQVAELDRRIGAVVAAAPGGADVVVGSLADAGRTERLRLAVARGPDYGPGVLTSSSTRQPGLVQSQDLTVTLISLAGLTAPTSLGGAVLGYQPASDNSQARASERLDALVDYDLASYEVHRLVPPFFTVFAYGQLGIYLLVLLVWQGRIGSERTRLTVLRWVRLVAIGAASVPASTFLANLLPWWRFPVPMLAVVGAVGGFVLVIGATAMRGPWAREPVGPMAAVAAVTLAVLAGDVMTGSRLQLSSLMGLQPVIAGRFYGMGNVTFALFATSAILLSAAVSSVLVRANRSRLAAAVVAGIGVLALVVDGAPFWGADGGGPPALVPGFAYLVLAILGIAITWRRVLLIAAASVLLFLAVGVVDWLRPAESRTHLGRFIQSAIDGGALDIVVRKAQQNLSILLGNAPLTLLVPAALLFFSYVLSRPTSWGSRALQRSYEQAPTLRAGLVALLLTLTIGFLVNDSGTAIPAVGAMLAIPLIVSVAVRALEEEARTAAPTRAARRVRG